MLNSLAALASFAVAFSALWLTHILRAYEALVPSLLAAAVVYIVLARRSFRQMEKILEKSAKVLTCMPPQFDQAITTMQGAYRLARWQWGIASQVDSQVGIVYFLQREFSKALPYLQRSLTFGHWMAGAMLAVVYYKKKNHAAVHRTMQTVTKRAKSQGLIWSLYAYLRVQMGDRDGAIKTLSEGAAACRTDVRLKENLLALQNNKKMKMRAYNEQWYQFHLERPPAVAAPQQAGMPRQRLSRVVRRGRW